MIKILIADDHLLVREGLKKVLKLEPDIYVSAEASNAAEALSALSENDIDVMILDITMPGRSGLDLLTDLKKMYPKMPVLILSMHSEDRYAIRALKSGASGYLTKESAASELVKAIRKVYSGGRYISESLSELLAAEMGAPSSMAPHERLSDREYYVMIKIAQGWSAQKIADELSLSLSTINTYRARILEKMNFKGNAELIRYAMNKELVD